jgi:hypothetical protein
MLKDWQNLISSINLIGDSFGELVNPSEFENFENQFDMIFPDEYKDFCQLFGTGAFQRAFTLYSPSEYLSEQQELLTLTIEDITRFPSNSPEEDLRKVNLLENAFIFGCDGGSYIFVWDLRTYMDMDKNYDIFVILWDSPSESFNEEIMFFGRSILGFVTDTLLTSKMYDLQESGDNTASVEYSFERYIPSTAQRK